MLSSAYYSGCLLGGAFINTQSAQLLDEGTISALVAIQVELLCTRSEMPRLHGSSGDSLTLHLKCGTALIEVLDVQYLRISLERPASSYLLIVTTRCTLDWS